MLTKISSAQCIVLDTLPINEFQCFLERSCDLFCTSHINIIYMLLFSLKHQYESPRISFFYLYSINRVIIRLANQMLLTSFWSSRFLIFSRWYFDTRYRDILRKVARHRADEALKSRILEFIAKLQASGRELSVNTRPQLRGSLHLPGATHISRKSISRYKENRISAPCAAFTAASL